MRGVRGHIQELDPKVEEVLEMEKQLLHPGTYHLTPAALLGTKYHGALIRMNDRQLHQWMLNRKALPGMVSFPDRRKKQ